WGVVLAIVGVAAQLRRDRLEVLALSALAASSSILALGYFTTDSWIYLLPALVSVFVWLGLGVEQVVTFLARRHADKWLVMAVAACLVALPAAVGLSRFEALDLSADRTAEQ